MNFDLTKEQKIVKEMVKDFAKREIEPNAEAWIKIRYFRKKYLKKWEN